MANQRHTTIDSSGGGVHRLRRRRVFGLAGVAIVAAAAVLSFTGTALSQSQPLTVSLDSGVVRGDQTQTARTFSGIPFAAPPVGELRWRPPQPVKPWDGELDATRPGNSCPQQTYAGDPVTTEDCLYLNVTTPPAASSRERPVVVWLHGGGFTSGAGSEYDAQRMAAQGDVVVVTVNYRLGVFGYFGYPGLDGSGDFGLADQIAALQWTKRNAKAFGGDAYNVTLAGQSAGGMSACALLTSPASKNLFDKAILSSGSCMLDWPKGVMFPKAERQTPYSSLADTQADGSTLVTQMECHRSEDPLACMRDKSAAELVVHNNVFANHLTYDTELLPQAPPQALREGRFHRVPVISGGNHDEMRSFIGGAILVSGPITPERYDQLAVNSFGSDAESVLARYPLSEYETPALAWSAVATDVTWACQTLQGDRLLADRTTVYAYEFNDPHAPNVNGIELPELPQGAAHATDLPYVFDLLGNNLLDTPEKQQLGAQMVRYWTSFAHHGEPDATGSPSWPRFDDTETVVGLVPAPDTGLPVDYAADHRCDFWQGLGY